MVKQTVLLAVDLTVKDGQEAAFERIAQEMAAGSKKEPGTLGYEWFMSIDHRRHRLIETYKDAAAVLAHFNGPVVRELVPKLLGTASVAGFEVYGDPGPKVREMVGGFGAEVFAFRYGLDR